MFNDKRMSKGGRKSEDAYHINRHTVRKSCSEIMDMRLRYRHISKWANKRKRHFGKPWWCDELNIYGKRRDGENAFLNSSDGIRSKTVFPKEYYQCR